MSDVFLKKCIMCKADVGCHNRELGGFPVKLCTHCDFVNREECTKNQPNVPFIMRDICSQHERVPNDKKGH